MSEDVRPVRAWAEYDEWLVFCDWDARAASFDDALWSVRPWYRVVIPKTGNGSQHTTVLLSSLIDCLTRLPEVVAEWGELRSIRVVLNTGSEVTVSRFMAVSRGTVEWGREWVWRAADAEGCFPMDGVTDADAVARAVQEAIGVLTGEASMANAFLLARASRSERGG